MKNSTPLTASEIMDWIANAGRELNATDSTDRKLNQVCQKVKTVGVLSNAAAKLESQQIIKMKMGIENEMLLTRYKKIEKQ